MIKKNHLLKIAIDFCVDGNKFLTFHIDKLFMWINLTFQRNHSLFGNVLNALTGSSVPKANAVPLDRSNSLHNPPTETQNPHTAVPVSPTTSLHSPQSPSSNEKTASITASPANSYLDVGYRNAKNHHRHAASPHTSSFTTPNLSDGSRRMR